MADLYLSTGKPQINDSEKLLLARLAANLAGTVAGSPGSINLLTIPLAARTASFEGPKIATPSWARGVILRQNTTVASGTGGLKLALNCYLDAAGTLSVHQAQASAFLTTTGVRSFFLHPAFTNAILSLAAFLTYGGSGPIAPYVSAQVLVGDATSYTYSVDLAFVP